MREQIPEVHRQYRRDLVPYDPQERRLVRGLDGLQQADDQEPGGDRGRAGDDARRRQPGDLSGAPAARAARPGAPRELVPTPRSSVRRPRSHSRERPSLQGAAQQPKASTAFSRGARPRQEEMRKLEDEYISTEHLLLALDAVPREEILARLKEVRGGQRVTSQDPEGTLPGAGEVRPRPDRARRAGKLDPVIGRDEEIRHVIQVLSHRTKNNPGPDRASQEWGRPRSSRASPSGSSPATCPRA